MHELSVTRQIFEVVLRHAEKNGANKVILVNLEIGDLCDMEPEWLQRYFDHLAKGTIAEGAELRAERKPASFRCDGCGHVFTVRFREVERVVCPECDATEGITRVKDLPGPVVVRRSRNYKRRRCPECDTSAYRLRTCQRTLHELGDPVSGRPRDLHVT